MGRIGDGQTIGIPGGNDAEVTIRGRRVLLSNLDKVFWPKERITKRQLLQYYADVSPWLLPHLAHRAMVMKRYPNGITGKSFFMKRTPEPHPEWLERCSIEHKPGNVIAFPVVNDLASLLWVVNLGCIDLNQWYGTCDDPNRPDYLHFDLDPVEGARFQTVCEAALILMEALEGLGMNPLVKTSGSRGIHVYVALRRGPLQHEVREFAKAFALHLAPYYPKLFTAEYRVAKRPRGRVLIDYNQNAWGRTLASVYSVRANPGATVSSPITGEELKTGSVRLEDYTIFTVPRRLSAIGDLWEPLLQRKGRFRLEAYLKSQGRGKAQ